MKKMISILLLALFSQIASANNDVKVAFGLCSILKNTGLVTECDVSGWRKAVDITMDVRGAEARQSCSIVSNKFGKEFQPGWTLNVLSPFSNGKAVATCPLS